MRLTDLKPRWILPGQWADKSPPFYIGLSFLHPTHDHSNCPTCGANRERRLAVYFWPPIDPENVEPNITPFPHEGWHRRVSGDTFETLTISPSIGLEPYWHGNITNGEVA